MPESEDPDRWSNTVFSQPEYVHFQTCGGYAPGEISATNHGHTIKFNGLALWNKGILFPKIFEDTNKLNSNYGSKFVDFYTNYLNF